MTQELSALAVAVARKIVWMALLFGGYKIIDNFYFKSFDTDEVVKENPIAVAILLGMFFIALALA
jgi:hypothetical protein